MRPLQNPYLRRISALCAARSLAYLSDMSALAALLRLELHPHLGVLQRSRPFDSCRLKTDDCCEALRLRQNVY
ncbi:lipoprotein signal peptidase [Neisseria sp. Dent CA1/247]|uniref:lipoprotein signal peptidase n=1 Tax=Neisseria sp. Dent CA1/247 TaxID=2912675 RepID=UPI001FD4C2B0|nr:lipoprotein signal peptidase [Neisseria sp. Dent CA1/247]UOO78264.1 lipoprotein signal peptidase [Neisseria sp. Dent CA1/247]